MKKILIVTRNFPPLRGGMERLNLRMAEELSRAAEVRLIAPEGAENHVAKSIAVAAVPLDPLGRFLCAAGLRAFREARSWRPDVVLAGSGLTAPMALIAARACGARAAAYVHGLDLTVPHPIYRAFWRPALRRLDAVIANSQATSKLGQDIGLSIRRISVIPPGVDLLPAPDASARERFRAAHDLGSGPVLLSV
ncbi:MAG: glycosyltransferase, partial [Candidatus Accumulibacter sp.]|nr:glycosyltransferase [Accumulibacter sp.]